MDFADIFRSVARSEFLPHGLCLASQPELILLHVASDAVTAFSYYTMPIALIYFAMRRKDFPYRWLLLGFGIFIFSCGTTHVFGIVTLWQPVYWLEGWAKLLTAITSVVTAVVLWPLIPKALALPSPTQLVQLNQWLHQEIAERTRTEAALTASQNRLLGITGNLFEGVLVVDGLGHILFANRSAQRILLGNEETEMTGRELDQLVTLLDGASAVPFALSPFRNVATTGCTISNDDAVFRQPDGVAIPVGFACAPLVENGKTCGAIISFRNIAALKQAQQEAVQASRLASIGQLAAGIAHEINTPIQYIGSNLHFMRESFANLIGVLKSCRVREATAGTLPEMDAERQAIGRLSEKNEIDFLVDELPAAILESLDGVAHVSEIVRSMKEFSHPGTTSKVATDLNRALESTAIVSRNEWRHFADVEFNLDPDLPLVVCLPGAINQVFLNLVVNAAQAIAGLNGEKAGKIKVSTHHLSEGVEIRIADNGTGVPAEYRDRIFDPFFTTKEVGKGTGQGLMICRDVVVTKHGGKISFESEPGQGTTFVVWLPVRDVAEAA